MFCQKHFTPTNFYSKHFLHHAMFTSDAFCIKNRLRQTIFTPNNIYTRKPRASHMFYTGNPVHRKMFTRHLLQRKKSTPSKFKNKLIFTTNTCFTNNIKTKQRLHHKRVAPETICKKTICTPSTKQFFHPTALTPNTFCTRILLHQTGGRVVTKHQQKPMNCKRQVRVPHNGSHIVRSQQKQKHVVRTFYLQIRKSATRTMSNF